MMLLQKKLSLPGHYKLGVMKKGKIMSIKIKSALLALVLTPALATAAQFPVAEEDPTYSRLYPSHEITKTVTEGKTIVDINRTIEQKPTAAGQADYNISDIYGVDFDVEHSAH